jgi:molybdopterin adenylyltransferase
MEILVLTISDRASKGIYEDLSGPAMENMLKTSLESCIVHRKIVPDETDQIIGAFTEYSLCDFIFTTGGTGISPRDVTPDATSEWCEKLVPGIGEYLRNESLKQTRNAVFSRAVAGIHGKTMVVNFPGSVKGAMFCLGLFIPMIPHSLRMITGEGH